MRAFIQCQKFFDTTLNTNRLIPMNENVYIAFYALRDMGFECIFFEHLSDLDIYNHNKDEIICGGIIMIRSRLKQFGIEVEELNYPTELNHYLKRKIWRSSIKSIISLSNEWPIFIKSVDQKRLTGKIIKSESDLIECGRDNFDVWCSNPINFVSEYRVYVRYCKVLDIKHYKGDWMITPDTNVIQSAVNEYSSAPNAYGIDFGVTETGETALIEVNDGFALGNYGLNPFLYAKMMLTRWAQITNSFDEFYYI